MSRPLSALERHVLKSLVAGKGEASVDFISQTWPGWSHKSGRGAIVGHVIRAGRSMQKRGLVVVINGKDQWDRGYFHLTTQGWDIKA